MNSQELNRLNRLKEAFETIQELMAISTQEKITLDLLALDVNEQIAQAREEQHTTTN